jgi:hypothetical protein
MSQLILNNITTPDAPAAGKSLIYAKDGGIYKMGEDGVESLLGIKTLLYDNTLSGSGSWDVSNLGGYTHLEWIIRGRVSSTTTRNVWIACNNDTTAGNYQSQQLYGGDAHGSGMDADRIAGWLPYDAAEANAWNIVEGKIFFYGLTDGWKTIRTISTAKSAAATGLEVIRGTWWKNTAAVTRLAFVLSADSFITGSRLQIYGIT